MSIFVGSAIRSWPEHGGAIARRWLCTAPVHRATTYPIILDLIESLVALDAQAAKLLDGVISPKWSFFGRSASKSATSDIHYNEISIAESDAEERFIVDSVCRLIAGLGPSTGIILRDADRYDPASAQLARNLVRAAQANSFTVAIDAPIARLQTSSLADLLQDAIVLPDGTESPHLLPPPTAPIFSHSVPWQVVTNVGVNGAMSVVGPGGVPYAAFSRNSSDPSWVHESGDGCGASVLHAWPPDGWDYLRRGSVPDLAKKPNTFHDQHCAYVFGMSILSRDFLFKYLIQAIRYGECWQLSSSTDLHARVAAARLATRVSTKGGFLQAEQLYTSTLDYELTPVERVEMLYELANCLAVQKKALALEKARSWYRQAFSALSTVDNQEDRLRWRIQLLNGLALVEYHERRDRKALQLENRARRIAEEHQDSFAYVSEWALRLLNLNTAKLVHTRLGHRQLSRKYLRENIERARDSDRERSHAILAGMLFDQGEYEQTIELLRPFVESGGWKSFDVTEEFFCRWLHALSLLATRRETAFRRELGRISAMAERFDAVKALELIRQLASLVGISLAANRQWS